MDRFTDEQKLGMMKRAKVLRTKHPTWKPEKLMRKVCEEYSIKLDLSDGTKLEDVLKQIANESSRSKPVSARIGRVNTPGKPHL
jgi:hypothetical protein